MPAVGWRQQLLSLRCLQRWRAPGEHHCYLDFDLGHSLQSLIPSTFQFTGNQSIGRIDRIVLSAGMGRLITGLLQAALQLSFTCRDHAWTGFRSH